MVNESQRNNTSWPEIHQRATVLHFVCTGTTIANWIVQYMILKAIYLLTI